EGMSGQRETYTGNLLIQSASENDRALCRHHVDARCGSAQRNCRSKMEQWWKRRLEQCLCSDDRLPQTCGPDTFAQRGFRSVNEHIRIYFRYGAAFRLVDERAVCA